MKLLRTWLLLALALGSSLAFAGARTVTLSVPGMDCELCPITIKKAITKVPGVSSVEALTKATANAGYPSTLKQ